MFKLFRLHVVPMGEREEMEIELSIAELIAGKLSQRAPKGVVVRIDQYTGFKDANGNKIFEGDVVRDDDTAVEGKVVWGEKQGQWMCQVTIQNEHRKSHKSVYETLLPGAIVKTPDGKPRKDEDGIWITAVLQ